MFSQSSFLLCLLPYSPLKAFLKCLVILAYLFLLRSEALRSGPEFCVWAERIHYNLLYAVDFSGHPTLCSLPFRADQFLRGDSSRLLDVGGNERWG